MSEPADNGLNCDRAFDLLVELACDELTPELAAAVRAHAEGCGRCGPELEQLSRVMSVAEALPLAEPSKAVEERILRAAREALAARAGGTEAREPVRRVNDEQRGWFSRLSEWALSPQVAMASVLLLMVGIGLYALPLGREAENVAFEATPEERVPAAPAASATAAPVEEPAAEPEAVSEGAAKELSSRARREASKDEAADKVSAKTRARAASGKASNALPRDDFDGLSGAKGGTGGAGYQKQQPSTAPGTIGMEKASPKKADSSGSGAFAPPPPSAAPAPSPSKSAAPPSKAAKPKAESAEPEAAQAPSAAAGGSARDQNMEAQAEEKSTAGAQLALTEGIAAARRGAYAQAVSLLSPVVNQGPENLRPSARLWLARSLRGQGKCGEAVRYYAPIVQQANVASDVLNEAADCYDRTGETAMAGKLRSRLNAQESKE